MHRFSFRRIAELLLRNRVFRRKLPREFGGAVIYVTPDSALQYIKPSLSNQSMSIPLFSLVRRIVAHGDHVWDIGANAGVLAFSAAHIVGPGGSVLAVEADYFLGWLLQRSSIANRKKFDTVQVLCAAVSDKTGFTTLNIAERGRASSGIQSAIQRAPAGGTRYKQAVTSVSLDSLLLEFKEPTLVKIDVEGAEALALRGATKLLSHIRPKIYIEVGTEQIGEVTDILRSNQYELFDGESPQFASVNQCVFNTLALPREKLPQRNHL